MKKKIFAGLLISILALQLSAFGVTAAETASDITEEEIQSEDTHFAAGTTDGQSYIQEFFGIRLDLDDSWTFASESELAELNKAAVDSISSDEVRKSLEEGNSYMDMYAENADTLQNINSNITRFSLTEALLFRTGSNIVLEGALPTVKSELEGLGYTNVSAECSETLFLGKSTPCINTSAYIETGNGDVPMYQKQVYITEGSYLFCITTTSFFEDTNQDIIDLIKPIS